MKSLVKYLEESFAIRLGLQALSREILGSLPLYLRANYTFYDGHGYSGDTDPHSGDVDPLYGFGSVKLMA